MDAPRRTGLLTPVKFLQWGLQNEGRCTRKALWHRRFLAQGKQIAKTDQKPHRKYPTKISATPPRSTRRCWSPPYRVTPHAHTTTKARLMPNRLTVPTFERSRTHSGCPALLMTIGAPEQWPVLISPKDFDLVTQATGHQAWGIQGRNVVVGDPARTCGRRAVVKIIAGIGNSRMRAVFRDGNPLNLMRENIGIQGRGGVFWLELQPGEADPFTSLAGSRR